MCTITIDGIDRWFSREDVITYEVKYKEEDETEEENIRESKESKESKEESKETQNDEGKKTENMSF